MNDDLQEFLDEKIHTKYRTAAIRCPGCKKRPLLNGMEAMSQWHTCPHCREEFDIAEWKLEQYPMAQRLLDDRVLREMRFWHLTYRKNWYENLPPTLLAHAGSMRTVMDRKQGFFLDYDGSGLNIHSIRLRDDVEISPIILNDPISGEFPEHVGEDARVRGNTVYRYWNRWEGPGHISLIMTKSCFYVEEE